MRLPRTLAVATAMATVLVGCGSAADPGQTLRDALEGFDPPESGTISVGFAGDLAAVADAFGDDAPDGLDAEAAEVLTGLEITVTQDGERVGVAVAVDGDELLGLRVPGPDELFLRFDLERFTEVFAAAAPEGEDLAGDMAELEAFLGGDGPFAVLLSGDWVRITGGDDAAGFDLGAVDPDELPTTSDVDVEAVLSALESTEVVDAGVDGRCGDAVRYDAVVDAAVAEELLGQVQGLPAAAAGDLGGLGGDLDLDLGLTDLSEVDDLDLAVWLDGDVVSCLGVDIGAATARSEADAGVAPADVAGLAHLVVRFSDDVTGADAPADATEVDLGELFAGLLGGAFEGAFEGGVGVEGDGDPGSDGSASTYGDDPALDALQDACAAGDGQACDDLYFQSPFGSAYEAFGDTCGGREEPGTVLCAEVYGSG